MVDPKKVLPSVENLTGADYHALSESQREAGDFESAVASSQKASDEYFKEGNFVKASEALASQMLSYRHLYEQTGDDVYKISALESIEKAVSILKNSGGKNGMGILLYNQAKYCQTDGDYNASISFMRDALAAFKNAPEDIMNTASQIAEISTRLAAYEFGLGDDEAYARFEKSLEELKDNPNPDEYTQGVWLSGAFMHMAEGSLMRHEIDKAQEFIEKAEKVIAEDTRYNIRREQIEKLKIKAK